MNEILYDLFLVTFGIVLGVIASEPLKKLFTGKYKEESRQKKRVQLLLYIRENKSKADPTTEELAKLVFGGKLGINQVYRLLQEIAETGLIQEVPSKEKNQENAKWFYLEK